MDNTRKEDIFKIALELETIKEYDEKLYEKIKKLIFNAKELKALKEDYLVNIV